MKTITYLYILIFLQTLLIPHVSAGVICRADDGYIVERRYLLLAPDTMTEKGLRSYFENLEKIKGELYIIATTDQEYFERLAHPMWSIRPHWETPPQIEVLPPLVYYFQLGDHRSIQVLWQDGKVNWINLDDENPLNRTFGSMRLFFAGHGFSSTKGNVSCDLARHKLVFYTKELGSREEILEAIEYYDRIFREPFLSLQIYDDLIWAITDETIRYPGLEFISQRKNPIGDLKGSVSFFRDSFWGRSLIIYEDSDIIFEKKW